MRVRDIVSTSTAIICSECGESNYSEDGSHVYIVCNHCAHEITYGEIEADEDEWIATVGGVVCIMSGEDTVSREQDWLDDRERFDKGAFITVYSPDAEYTDFNLTKEQL